MSNTIEKALQKQREAEAKKKQDAIEQQQPEQVADEPVIERAVQAKQNAEQQPPENTAPAAKEEISPAVVAEAVDADAEDADATPERFIDIDISSLDERGFVSINDARRLINEEYREIKRKLLKNAFGALSRTLNNSNIIMVSSARPSEGKTFTAINLALSIASEQDKTVLLVDADVLKPNVMRTLQVKAGDGLMEYLLDPNKDLSEVMYRTNIDKLRIIPAGRTHHLSTELLASERMSETIDEFANRYSDRIVIIDTPPLVGINESAVMASFAGQAVIVTEEGRSRLTDIKTIVDRLNPDMAVGFVVNKAVNESANDAGYYGYYYSQGHKPE